MAGTDDPFRPVNDGMDEDLLVIATWARKELFTQVKFLYQPEEDLAGVGARAHLEEVIVGLQRSAVGFEEDRRGGTNEVSIVIDTVSHFGIMQPKRRQTW